jgi:hypothetical protein
MGAMPGIALCARYIPVPRVVLYAVLSGGERSSTVGRRSQLGAVPERGARRRVKERQVSGVDHELDLVARLDRAPVGRSGDEGAGALDCADEELVGATSLDGVGLELDAGAWSGACPGAGVRGGDVLGTGANDDLLADSRPGAIPTGSPAS